MLLHSLRLLIRIHPDDLWPVVLVYQLIIMKKILTSILVLLNVIANAQVAINNNGANPDANAMLDVQSTSKGLKLPRMTTDQRKAIPVTTADAGLFVFDTDKQKLYMYDGNEWRPLATATSKNSVLLTNVNSTWNSKNSLGNAVAIDGEYAVAGSRRDTINGVPDLGSATVFKLTNGIWKEQAKLVASDGVTLQRIGNSVAIAGDFAAVGAEETKVGNNLHQGAVYIYKRTGETWAQVDKLVAADGINAAGFGHRVAMQGNILIVSADGDKIGSNISQGSVYVYTYNGAAWVQTQKLLATDGAAHDRFGSSISFNQNWLAIGSPYDDVGAVEDAGTVHIYIRSGGSFLKNQQFPSTSPTEDEFFGFAVSIKNDTIAVTRRAGLPFEQVTLYRRPNTNTWVRFHGLYAPSFEYDSYSPFGYEVIWRNSDLIVSSPSVEVNDNTYQGAIYYYTYTSSLNYQLTKKITDPDGFIYSQFGTSMAISGNRFIFGSMRSNVFFGTFDE